jgi:hypothetical protein
VATAVEFNATLLTGDPEIERLPRGDDVAVQTLAVIIQVWKLLDS